jgi:hypothetical protein
MVVHARRGRGRHARVIVGVPGQVRSVARGRLPAPVVSRRAQLALGGTAGLGLVIGVTLVAAGTGRPPRAAAVDVRAGRRPPVSRSTERAAVAHGTGDADALAYYRAHDTAGASHVSEIVWTGPMLRVYTDLPASKADSGTAIALCETAAAYLAGRGRMPVVFVHAGRSAGYPVLANKLDAEDGCRLNSVP